MIRENEAFVRCILRNPKVEDVKTQLSCDANLILLNSSPLYSALVYPMLLNSTQLYSALPNSTRLNSTLKAHDNWT